MVVKIAKTETIINRIMLNRMGLVFGLDSVRIRMTAKSISSGILTMKRGTRHMISIMSKNIIIRAPSPNATAIAIG